MGGIRQSVENMDVDLVRNVDELEEKGRTVAVESERQAGMWKFDPGPGEAHQITNAGK